MSKHQTCSLYYKCLTMCADKGASSPQHFFSSNFDVVKCHFQWIIDMICSAFIYFIVLLKNNIVRVGLPKYWENKNETTDHIIFKTQDHSLHTSLIYINYTKTHIHQYFSHTYFFYYSRKKKESQRHHHTRPLKSFLQRVGNQCQQAQVSMSSPLSVCLSVHVTTHWEPWSKKWSALTTSCQFYTDL